MSSDEADPTMETTDTIVARDTVSTLAANTRVEIGTPFRNVAPLAMF